MDSMKWLYNTDDPLIETLASCAVIFVVIIVFTRIIGLRSFSKFTGYDFAFTIAIGGIISGTITSNLSIVHATVAIGGLLLSTLFFALLKRKYSGISNLILNAPLLLMDKNGIIQENMNCAHVEEKLLIAKLRESGVINFNQVIAVVLETSGEISVMKKIQNESDKFDEIMLMGVKK